jgi:hypothetical protein
MANNPLAVSIENQIWYLFALFNVNRRFLSIAGLTHIPNANPFYLPSRFGIYE